MSVLPGASLAVNQQSMKCITGVRIYSKRLIRRKAGQIKILIIIRPVKPERITAREQQLNNHQNMHNDQVDKCFLALNRVIASIHFPFAYVYSLNIRIHT